MALQPFDGQLDDNSSNSLTPFDGRLDGEGPPQRTLGDAAKDVGIATLKGAIGLPEAAVGIADLATGGYAGKAAEAVGFRPRQAKDMLDEHYSDAQKAANEQMTEAKGFLPTVGAMVRNPSTIVQQAIESAPSMILGGGFARGALAVAPKLGAITAGALGEGAVAAGQNAEQVRQEEADGTLSGKQAAILAASGALTGGISRVAGAAANKMGVGDISTMLARGKFGPVGEEAITTGASKGLLRRVGEGALIEGVMQELPQSYQEQAAQNIAQGKPWDEGAAEAGAQGMMAGALLGAGGNLVHGEHAQHTDTAGDGNVVPPTEVPPASPTTPVDEPVDKPLVLTPSEQLGLNPDAGPLSAAAALAVDGGASDHVQTQTALQQMDAQTELDSFQPTTPAPEPATSTTAPAKVPPTTQQQGNQNGPETTQAQQTSPPPAQAAAAPAATGLDGAPATAQLDAAAHQAATSPQNDLPEPTQAQKEAGNYPKGHASIDGNLTSTPEEQRAAFAAAETKRKAGGDRARASAYERNPFRAFLGKHGISPDAAREYAPGNRERKSAMVPGYGPIFRQGGKPLDRLAQAAVEEGYLASPDVAELEQLIGRVFRGERVIPQYAEGAAEAEMQRLVDARRQMEEDAASVEIEDDADIPWIGPGNASDEEFLRALGLSDEEIQREISTSQITTGALRRDTGAAAPEPLAIGPAQGGDRPGEGATGQAGGRGVSESAADTGGLTNPSQASPHRIEGDQGGPVARESTADYSDAYATDLFGEPLPATAGKDRPARPEGSAVRGNLQPAAGDTPAPAGEYLVNTHVAAETRRRVGTRIVNTPAQAAQATAYLYKSAVERFDGIVTDQAGKVLAVVGGFKGAVTQTSVYPGTLVAEAIRVPGAARIWFSHNHPSGSPQLSPADEHLNRTLGDVFKGSGIEPMGILAVAGDKFMHQDYAGQSTPATPTEGDIPAGASPVKVPVYERELSPSTHAGEALTSPTAAKDVARRYYGRQGGPGIMMLDAQNSVAGWVPITEDMKRPLRGGALSQVYRALSQSNAASAIIVHGGELDTTGGLPSGVTTVSQNIAQALAKMDVKPLDSIHVKTGQSAAEQGLAVASGPLFSRAPAAGNPEVRQQEQRAAMVHGIADAIRKGWANAPQIVVAANLNDPVIPQAARLEHERQQQGGAMGEPEAVYHGGRVYLLASRLHTPLEVARALYHEVLGHHGLRGFFGKDLDGILNQIATMRRADVAAKIKAYGLQDTPQNRRTAAEEVLAEMAQSRPDASFVQRAIAAIKTWLRANVPGLQNLALSDAEIIRHYILPARRFVEQGAAPNQAPAPGSALPVFSRAVVAGYARTAMDELNKTFSAPGKLNWWHKTIGTMYNLAERSPAFKRVFDAAQGFIDDVSYYANDAAELAPKLLPKLETWRDIAKSPITAGDNKAIAAPIFEGTLVWSRDEAGKPTRIADMAKAAESLSTQHKAQALLRAGKLHEGVLKMWQGLPQEQYENLIASSYESKVLTPGAVWSDAELKSMFQLSDAQVALYHEFRESTNRSLDTMARADMLRFAGEDVRDMREQVMDASDAQEAAVLLRDRLIDLSNEMPDRSEQFMATANGVIDRADKLADLQGKGYAPLSRFGQYTVDVVENGERQYFGLFETKREANEMAARMRQAFGEQSVSQGTLSNEAFKLFAGITPESLELFGNMLGLDATGDGARDQAFQEYLRLTKTNRSAMRRLIHRQGIAGFSEDVGRVLASFVYSNARQTAAGLNMGNLGEAVAAIPKEQGELKDAAVRLAEYIKNPQEEAQAVRGLLFAQYLGGSVASAFVNMTQPVAISFPWLSQYGGARKAASELARAARQMATHGYPYEPELARALHLAEEDGTVSPQEVHQLMAQARGAGTLRPGDGTRLGDARAQTQNALSRLSMAWGKVFGAAEQVNRRMTFIAAYRMAVAKGMENPAEFAKKAVEETQFIYSKANKMQWGRGAVGGTLMTFKTYSIAYLEVLHRMYTQGGPEGKKATVLALGMLMLMGGAGGLPFAEDAQELAEGLAQLLGYNISAQKSRQELLEGIFGKGLAEFIDSGVSGLPGMPLDVSGRLGMGKLIPGIGLVKDKSSHTRDVLEIAGPAGDFASRILSGGRRVLGGDLGAGLLEMSPQAVRNAAKGVDMAATGLYRDAKGYKVLETNHLEAALKAIGFQPASVANVQASNAIHQQAKNVYNLRAQDIRAQWAAGIFEGEQGQVDDARAAIAQWNRKNAEQPMIITVPSVLHKVQEMRKTKEQRIADAAPRAMRAQMKADILARAN